MLMRACTAISVGVVLCACAVAAGGDLNPAAGVVAPTMKTLDQIEARRVLNDLAGSAVAEHVITEPGQYYLTGNIVAGTGRSATVVDLAADPGDDPVSIDMNGFSILGGVGSLDGVRYTATFTNDRFVLRSGVAGSRISGMGGDGVHVDGAGSVTVRGISISNVGGDGIDIVGGIAGPDRVTVFVVDDLGGTRITGVGGDGVRVENAGRVFLTGMTVSDCGGGGVEIIGNGVGAYNELSEVLANGNTTGGIGFRLWGDGTRVVMRRCTAVGNGGDGIVFNAPGEPVGGINVSLEQIVGGTNGGSGVKFSWQQATGPTGLVVRDSTFDSNTGNGVDGDGNGIFDGYELSCNGNGGDGIHMAASAATLSGCTSSGNGGHGLTVSDGSLADWGGVYSGNGGSGLRVIDCSSQININGAVCTGNTDRGIHVLSSGGIAALSASVRECSADGNGGSGITVSDVLGGCVTGCSAFANGTLGIEVLSFGHVMTGNIAGGNPGGNYFAVLPGNAVGSVVDSTTIGTEDNSTVNLSP